MLALQVMLRVTVPGWVSLLPAAAAAPPAVAFDFKWLVRRAAMAAAEACLLLAALKFRSAEREGLRYNLAAPKFHHHTVEPSMICQKIVYST